MSLLLMVVFRVPNFYTFDIHLSINFIMIRFFTQLSLIIFEVQQHPLPNEISNYKDDQPIQRQNAYLAVSVSVSAEMHLSSTQVTV